MYSVELEANTRLHRRRPIRGQALLEMTNGIRIPVKLFDISESGVCVISELNLHKGINFMMSTSVMLDPPTVTHLVQQVHVKYSIYSFDHGGFRVGFGFKEASQDIVRAIKTYVNAIHHTH